MASPLRQRSLPAFLEQLDGWDVQELEGCQSLVVGTWLDGTIGYFNLAWEAAAQERGAGPDFWKRWGTGANIHEAGGTKPSRGAVVQLPAPGVNNIRSAREFYYQCDGPTPGDEHLYCVRTLAVPPAEELLLMIHSEVASPSGEGPDASAGQGVVGIDGLAIQCSHCQRVRLPGNPERWLEIKDPLPGMDRVSHGLCPVCFQLYATLT